MNQVITPEDVPRLLECEVLDDSSPLGWDGLKLKGYRTPPQDLQFPMMCDYALLSYGARRGELHRRTNGPWQSHTVGPGVVSVLTRAEESHWRWNEPLEAIHVYLPYNVLAGVAAEVFERDIADIELLDVLGADDTVLTETANSLATESRVGGLGGRLYVEALRCQICVHIIRTYATVAFREHRSCGGLSQAQRRMIIEFIEENIGRNISLAELAGLLQLSVFHFSRKFRREFGCPPYAYVIQQRLEYAKRQLRRGNVPLKVVAANSGFADQSHMTRLFRRVLNVTPGEYRNETSFS
ncbi:helix-turn-helix transcriptional regulator [Chelativorans salis]|uniref:AraC family transcriptional regulator n=1 Tax=Chelativorans salis TaxID=2978478 RepID=A0ABT2LHN8_9HYPH|nr:AraC family transcriptional regulator [Chelativorans sp. EGI FJ00035]MCT7374010.1 AraC family transcriptional regulator [Chelativorans sp. EGI FJ00035]